jgi:hypothetical protein
MFCRINAFLWGMTAFQRDGAWQLRKQLAAIFIAAFAFLAFGAAFAADKKAVDTPEPPMSFTLVRSNAPGCEPNCPQWIAAKGQIIAGTAKRFEQFLKALGKTRHPIVVSSGGGRVDAAMQMGRLIRKLKLDVAVGATSYSGCAPDDKKCKLSKERRGIYSGAAFSRAYCNSACPLLLAAGTRRVAGSWSFVGVHQITTIWTQSQVRYKVKYRMKNGRKQIIDKKIVGRKVVGNFSTTKIAPAFKRKLDRYFLEMGVDAKILERMLAVPASDIAKLTQVEMLDLRLVTSLDQVELFTGAAICQLMPPAANCVLAEPAAVPKVSVTKVRQMVIAAESAHSMWFVVVRSDAPNCTASCPAWISAEGRIDQGAASRFQSFIKTDGRAKLPLVINSVGGDLLEAIALANAVRMRGLNVSVGKTRFSGCEKAAIACNPLAPENLKFSGSSFTTEAYCDVACSLVLASGIRRYAGSMAYVGLGQAPTPSNSVTMSDAITVRDHYERMGVNPSVFDKIMMTDRISADVRSNNQNLYGIRKLHLSEMLDAKLVTGSDQVDVFTSPSICMGSKPAPNCMAANSVN